MAYFTCNSKVVIIDAIIALFDIFNFLKISKDKKINISPYNILFGKYLDGTEYSLLKQ